MTRLALFLLLLLFPIAAAAQSANEKTRIESEIAAVMNAQVAAWNRGDVDAFMDGYWKSEKLVFASGDDVTRGWQTTLDRYKKNYNSREKMGVLKFDILEVNVVSKDAAIVLGSWAITRAGDNPKGKFTLVFRKMKEGWRVVHDHTS